MTVFNKKNLPNSGKLKLMLPYIADAGKNFGAYAEKISQEYLV